MQHISSIQKRQEWTFKACSVQVSLPGHPHVALQYRQVCLSAKCQCVSDSRFGVYNGSGEKQHCKTVWGGN